MDCRGRQPCKADSQKGGREMKRQTNYNLEFLRFIATIGVVFVHVGVCWIAAYGKSASSLANYIFSTIQHCMMWAVPVFMMITGCLMMRKEELSYRTAFRYFKRIGLLVVMFGTAFAWLELVFINHSISPDIIWKGIINMLQGETWEHLWYLYMLLGIYLILPLLHAYKRITPPHITFATTFNIDGTNNSVRRIAS